MSYNPSDMLSDAGFRLVFSEDEGGDAVMKIVSEAGDVCATFDGSRGVQEHEVREVELIAWGFVNGIKSENNYLGRALEAEKKLRAIESRVATFLEGLDGLR